ncbi:uncharacterized protein LOC111053200 isoform X2 [Nilaparvata lugens]|uniref:uncharacterized protein LOC111053200 isoform X2 n=1 Tax=Nilaparvata lugens TaxID=108931 RepID=UPI00193D6419|nr:uncharacterized protein LOC111053200 isoform X2 [Nilaparvata lugens]
MSITYNKLYSDSSREEEEIPLDLESIEVEEKSLKSSDAVVKAREHMALLQIKYAISKLIVKKYFEGTIIPEDYELCILQNYLSIVNRRLKELQNENPKLFDIVGRLNTVVDIVDGESTLNDKLSRMNNEFPEFSSALERIRVLIEEKQVLKEEKTQEYNYPDFPHSNYVLTKKIKECIAERRKRKFILNLNDDSIDTFDDESSMRERENSSIDYTVEQEKDSVSKIDDQSRKNVSFGSSSLFESQESGKSVRSSDPLIKFLLVTGIKKNLGSNNENVENELKKLELSPEFKENLTLEIDNPESKRVKNLMTELRDKIINFNECKDVRLYRKTPKIPSKCVEAVRRQKLEENSRFKSSEAKMHNMIREFRRRNSHTEEEIDELVNSRAYKKIIEKMVGKREGKHERKSSVRKPRESELLNVITKKLSEVKHDDSAKFEFEELDEMRNEELIDLLSSFVPKQDHEEISQTSSVQRSVRFSISKKDQKSVTSSKSMRNMHPAAASWFPLEEKSSEVVSKDSFLDPGPRKSRQKADSVDEMMSRLTMNDDSSRFQFFKTDLINEKATAARTYLRPARYSDLSELERLINDRTMKLFGDKSLSYYFEYSNACIVQISKDNKLVAFIAIQNDPPLPSLPPSSWDVWIHDLYGEQDNIDIMPELNRTAPELGRIFGDYLISELVRFSTKDRIGLTAFANEKIVGYALLNSNVCVSNLNKYFEVAAFNGFYVHHEKDQFPPGRREKLIEENYPKLPEKLDDLFTSDISSEVPRESSFTRSSSSYNVDSDEDFLRSSSSDENIMEEIAVPQSFIFSSDFAKRRPTQLIDKNDLSFQSSDKLKINLKPRLSKGILTHHVFRRDFLHMEIEMSNPPPIKVSSNIPIEPVYYGEPNVVMIEIFLMLRGVDFRLSYDFLEAIFEVINVDYCILSFPTSDPIPPIVDHFARLIPKMGTWFPHEVYVLHRSYILSAKTVRAANRNDFSNILMLTSKLVNYKKIRDDFLDSQFSPKTTFESYVLLCSDVIVGLCIIDKTPLVLSRMEVQFDIEKYMAPSMYHNHANIKHCCIHPIFSTCSTILFREVIRLSSVYCLFYRLYEEDIVNTDLSAPTIISCIADLVPVVPRKSLQYHSDLAKGNVITINRTSDPNVENSGFFCSFNDLEENKKSEKFALFFINTKVGSLLKRCIHLKIVIVGASDTALSFIESLIFRTEMEVVYTNIVLVSPNGLPYRQKPHAARDAMGIFRGRYNRDFMTQLGMNAWINVSYGYMTSIDRNKKFITINYEKKINYDYLFLFTGQQFMKPVFHTFDEKFELSSPTFFTGNDRFTNSYVSECPMNMFLLNSDVDASYSLLTIQKLLESDNVPKEGKFVVYGHMLEAFAVLNALTKFGIPTNRIAFVEPFPNEPAETLFNDTAIDEAVLSTLEKEGFAVYSRYYLINWDFDKNTNLITNLHFQSIDKVVCIECVCLCAFDFKSTDLRTFIALVNSQLVYDGKLVIDNEFRTNDQYIYAAGPLTRYSRSYYSEHMDHEFYNSIEIGMQVHKRVRHILDSRSSQNDFERRDSDEFPSSRDVMGLHQLHRPRVESCQLPGGWNYLRVIKPGKVLPLENQLANKHLKGPTFITGNCSDKTGPGYFKLVLDHNRNVIEIVCYTQQDIEIHNLIKLYGKHVAFFNNLEQRYNLGTVHDLFDYFRQPWVYAMYHDKFYFIEKKNRRLFYNTKLPNESNKTFSDLITDKLIENEWEDLGVSAVEDLRKLLYNNTKISEEIRANLKSFLVANELCLPMYINDEYIIVKKDEASKHHLHKDPPLGVSPKTLKTYLELVKNVPEGMTMQEFQKRYFKKFEDKCVNTQERGFCITSYLSLHSGADTCDNCEEYRKLKTATSVDEGSEYMKTPQKSPMKGVDCQYKLFGERKPVADERDIEKADENMGYTYRNTTDKMTSRSSKSFDTVEKQHLSVSGSNLSLNDSIRKKSCSQIKLDDDPQSKTHYDPMVLCTSQESSSKLIEKSSGTNLESPSRINAESSELNDKSPSKMKLEGHFEGISPSKTQIGGSKTSDLAMKRTSSLLKTDHLDEKYGGVAALGEVSNLKDGSKTAQEIVTESQPKLLDSSQTDLKGKRKSLELLKSKTKIDKSSSANDPNPVDLTRIEKPVSLENELGVRSKVGDSQSMKYPSSKTSIDKKSLSGLKDGSRKKLDDSKTLHKPVTSSKSSDLNKGSRLSGKRSSSEIKGSDKKHLQSKSADILKKSFLSLKPGSISRRHEEINKTLQDQLESSDKFVEVKKYDTISQSSFSPLLLDDLLDHVSKVQNLDITSFEDVHNVRWKRIPAEHKITDKNLSAVNNNRTQKDVGTSTPQIKRIGKA